jgi:hypothetical protein
MARQETIQCLQHIKETGSRGGPKKARRPVSKEREADDRAAKGEDRTTLPGANPPSSTDALGCTKATKREAGAGSLRKRTGHLRA